MPEPEKTAAQDLRIAELEDRLERVRAACVPLGPLAAGVLAVLDGDLTKSQPDWTAVRDAVGEDAEA